MKWLTLATVMVGSGIVICSLSEAYQYRTWRVSNLIATVRQENPPQTRSTASFNPATIEIRGGRVTVEFASGNLDLNPPCSSSLGPPRRRLLFLITTAASRVSEARILIVPVEGVVRASSVEPAGEHVPPPAGSTLGQRTKEEDLKK